VSGSVCFIERGKAPFVNKTRNCYAGGGIATVIYNLEASCENIDASYFDQETYIPAVSLTHLDGKAIRGDFTIGDIADGFESTEKEEVATPCEFCATASASTCSSVDRWDMKYPERT
jgi:hypothetical protein